MEVSVLIANYEGKEAIQLCLESILKRTKYPDYRILVYNSPANGSDLTYLQRMAGNEKTMVVEGTKNVNHGWAIWQLINICDTDWAITLDNDSEILDGNWIDKLFGQIKKEKDIGVARFRSGGLWNPGNLFTPFYWVACMLINLRWYKTTSPQVSDWSSSSVRFSQYRGKYKFENCCEKLSNCLVTIDTGSGFTTRLMFDIPGGYNMQPMPDNFWDTSVKHYGGISRNYLRPEHPWVAPRLAEIKQRLAELRKQ